MMIIDNAGIEDSTIWAWLDKSKVAVESVSKLKGRKIKVRGSSFTISIKTSNAAVKIVSLIKGRLTLVSDLNVEVPRVCDAWLRESQLLSMPALIGCHATARKRTIYANISKDKVPVST